MRIEIEIPKEFECDYGMDKLRDFFSRVLHDISKGRLCGKYEQEIAEMLQKAFVESKVAYDVESKVAKLEKFKELPCGCCGLGCGECEYLESCLTGEEGYKVALDRAISIVRGKE